MQEQETERRKALLRMLTLISKTDEHYKQNIADEDARNLAYYRGEFWTGDGIAGASKATRGYAASQNEVFPVVDSVVSSLVQDVPQVECLDVRVRRVTTPSRIEDPTMAGRGLAAVVNLWAEEDELDVTLRKMILNACVFRYGVTKTIWDPQLNRSTTTERLPWEVHFDPSAKRVRDAGWAYERFTMHWDDLQANIKSGVYNKPERAIRPVAFPRSLVDDELDDEHYRVLRENGINEWVSLVEFWDFRRGMMYHIDPESKQVLMETKIPWGNPYTTLTFHDAVGRIEGIPDVSLIADTQRDINEQVSARREIIRRLPRRMMVDRALWTDENEWDRFKQSKTYEPTRVRVPTGRSLAEFVYVTPEMPTTFDFNNHLAQSGDSLRRVAGLADFQRGSVRNIRTAAEAYMIQGSADGRVNVRMKQVVRMVTSTFKLSLECWRWALRNQQVSKIDMEEITVKTQADVAPDVLAREAMELTPQFHLLPFSPLMDDKHTRRQTMVQMLQALTSSGVAQFMDQRELAREMVDEFGWRPSIVKSSKQIEEEAAAIMSQVAAAQGAPPGEAGPEEGPPAPPLPLG